MKKTILLFPVLIAGCATNAPQTANVPNANVAVLTKSDNSSLVASSHSAQNTPPANSATQNPGGRNPMERAIDTAQMDADIAKTEKEYKQNPNDKTAKLALAAAYFVRAKALREVAQYRAALGDFRRGLKLDPENQEAKAMHDEIVRIFGEMKRELPKEGEEPPPLKKQS